MLAGAPGGPVDVARLVHHAREAGDGERLAESLRWLSRLHWWNGSRQASEAASARAITVLEPLPPGHQLAMAWSNQAQLDMLGNCLAAAMGWAARAIELARRLDDGRPSPMP